MEAFAEVARLVAPQRHVVAVEDVDFTAPVKFYRDQPRTVTITALVRPDGEDLVAECRLTAERVLPGSDEPQKTVHFSGSVRLSEQPPAPAETATVAGGEPVAKAENAPAIAPDDVYRLYFHGPAYQVVAEAWRSDGVAAGRLAADLPDNHEPAEMPTVLGPRLEELCFQVAGLWEAGREGRLALPAHVDRVEIHGDVHEADDLVAVAQPVADGVFDCEVLDGEGRVLVRLQGYRTVPLPAPLPEDIRAPLRDVMS
jgi:hypothetical protein